MAPDDRTGILVVSPERQDHAYIDRLFPSTRWMVVPAHTGADALDMLHRFPIHIILCEDRLPDTHWRDLLEIVHRTDQRAVFVVCTQAPDNTVWGEALNRGAFDVLMKPFDKSEVLHVVGAAWQRWRKLAATPRYSGATN